MATRDRTGEQVRLGELLAALSLATDLGNGFPIEKALRTCLLAVGIAERLELRGRDLSDVFYLGLLGGIGCTSFAHEFGRAYGDDIATRNAFAPVDFGKSSQVLRTSLAQVGKGGPPLRRFRAVAKAVTRGNALGSEMVKADCQVAVRLAERLAISSQVEHSLGQLFERWDGKGAPAGLAGDGIELAARIGHVAHEVEIFQRAGGPPAAMAMARDRAGGWFDPSVVEAFLRGADDLLAITGRESVWDAVLDVEPEPRPRLPAQRLDEIALVFADIADLKSPYTLGHSREVAALAETAARARGLAGADLVTLRHAALLHDLGRVSVAGGIWDKKGPLSAAEWERVRLHAYQSERILSRTPLLEEAGRIAGLHHERLDASGYHRGAPSRLLDLPARILAAADVYQACTQLRPHRPAMSPEQAARTVEAEVVAGRLDGEAAAAVVESAGQDFRPARREWPGGLSDREVDVLRLLARGLSKKQIARTLVIAPGTVHTHVTHIYGKLGVSTRAAVALFAVEHDLIGPGR